MAAILGIGSLFLVTVGLVFGPAPEDASSPSNWAIKRLHSLVSKARNAAIGAVCAWAAALWIGIGMISDANSKPPPFRITYYSLHDATVDFVLAGRIDKVWEKRLSRQPFIVDNEVLKYLRNLSVVPSYTPWEGSYNPAFVDVSTNRMWQTRKLSRGWGGVDDPDLLPPRETVVLGGESVTITPEEDLTMFRDVRRDSRWRIGPNYYAADYTNDIRAGIWPRFSYYRLASLDEARDVVRRRVAEDGGGTDEDSMFFVKYGRTQLEHLGRYERGLMPNVPSDLFVLEYSSDEHEGGEYIGYVPPSVTLRVVVLENVSDKPLRIEGLLTAIDSTTRPRTSRESRGGTAIFEVKFPPGWLLPGEMIMVPLSVELSNGELPWRSMDYLVPPPRGDSLTTMNSSLLSVLDATNHPKFEFTQSTQVDERLEEIKVPVERTVARELLTRKPFSTREVHYVVGPVVTVTSIRLAETKVAVRAQDEHDIVAYWGVSVGSCPFVASRSQLGGNWTVVGPILTGFNSHRRASIDSIQLPHFDGTIMLIEKEAETTKLDYLVVVEQTESGMEYVLSPNRPELRANDGSYLVLNPGDSTIVRFSNPRMNGSWSYRLLAKGYYEPIHH